LQVVNATLWHLAAENRDCEPRADFGSGLIALACAVSGSALTEEKAYDTSCCPGGAAAMPARRRDGGVQPTSPSGFCRTV
jgi:hypothetical protein